MWKRVPVLLLLLAASAYSQEIRAVLSSDSSSALIGAWIHARLEVEAPKQWKRLLPSASADIVGGDFVSAGDSTRSEQGANVLIRRDYILACFDTGKAQLRLRIRYTRPDDTTRYTIETNAISLVINGIPVDTAKDYRDIKDVLDVPYTVWEILAYVGLMLLIAALGWYAWKRFRFTPPVLPEVEEEAPPPVPAYELALGKLKRLEEQRLWQQGRHKEYQSELSTILREYIESRFGQPALEQTTDEIMSGLTFAGLDPATMIKIEQLLRISDMAKFAKYTPASGEHMLGMSIAREFLELTRPAGSDSPAEETAHA